MRRHVHKPLAETTRRMKAVRLSLTEPEVTVAHALSLLGLRYRKNVRSLPGSPDLANRAAGWAVFVHGCFWHRHPRCRFAALPKTNTSFWLEKLKANRRRDLRKKMALKQLGFRVVIVWECEARRPDLGHRLARALKGV